MEIKKTCQGCGKELGAVEATMWEVCLDCTKARHLAAAGGGCKCGSKARPTEVKQLGSRRWISCNRCLGQIRQLS